jgi:ELWxxDGT repeat protein
MVSLGDRLVFMGTDGVHGFEPWVTDGTAEGTRMLADLHPTQGSYPSTVGAGWIAVRGNTAVFVAARATDDFQLYKTDGTLAGTGIVTPPNATVTVNPMGREGFSGMMIPNMVPTLVGDTFVFRGGFEPGPHLLYKN